MEGGEEGDIPVTKSETIEECVSHPCATDNLMSDAPFLGLVHLESAHQTVKYRVLILRYLLVPHI